MNEFTMQNNTIKNKVIKVGRMYLKKVKIDRKHRFENGLLHGAYQANVVFTGKLSEAKRFKVSNGNADDTVNDNNNWFDTCTYVGNMGFDIKSVVVKPKVK